MIIEALLSLVNVIVNIMFTLLDVLPDFPAELVQMVDQYFSLIFDNLGLAGFFLPMTAIKIVVPLAILVLNWEHVYSMIMWILRKIPVINVK